MSKGSGAVIHVGETVVKASSVDRNFSLGKLCKRLGEFEDSLCLPAVPPAQPEPVSHVCAREWHEYQEERRRHSEEGRLERERRIELQRREREKERQERETGLARIAPYGLPILNIARHCMMLHQKSRKAEKRKEHVKSRKRVTHFKNWLSQKSHHLSQLWRFRNRITPDMQVREFRFDQLCKLKKPFACFRDMVREKYADVHMD